MNFPLYRWLKISLINLMIVAILGVLMRYKIAFSFPFVDQKHLLHAHSHFAFTGWITQALLALMVGYLAKAGIPWKKYNWLLAANLVCAYGMLLSFPFQGYGLFSITFSTLSIVIAAIFTVYYWKDLNKIESHIAHFWFKAALAFNVFSSLGAFSLSAMMINKTIHQNWYLAAVYFFLHFQYNGWFFFSCMGFCSDKLVKAGISQPKIKRVFSMFFIACIPAYFLSVLWIPLPDWIYIIIVIAALLQLIGWVWMIKSIRSKISELKHNLVPMAKSLFLLAGIALTIKLILQAFSVIPQLSVISYAFRPIIIGYLHLVLLGIFTLFLLGYMFATKVFATTKIIKAGIFVFTAGIILNELFLMIQGITAMSYVSLPYMNEALFAIAFIMFLGLLITNIKLSKHPVSMP